VVVGFYDCRCMVTGLVLTGETTLVPLRREGDTYRPMALGLSGSYDRYGAVDCIEEDANARLVFDYILDRWRDGRFVVDTEWLHVDDRPPVDIDELVWLVERNCLSFDGDPPVATLDGRLVTFAMIAQPVWDALAAAGTGSPASLEEQFDRLFADSPPAGEIYRRHLPEVAEQVRQLAAVHDFIAVRGQVWKPTAEPDQPYPTDMGAQYYHPEMRTFLAVARKDLADVAVLRPVFDGYAAKVAEYEAEATG
jgi:hypothetical protein